MATNTALNVAAISFVGMETGQGSGDVNRTAAPYQMVLTIDGGEWRYVFNNTSSAVAANTVMNITLPTGSNTTLNGNVYPAPGANVLVAGTGWTVKTAVPAYGWGWAMKTVNPL
mgnify:CR=1 FL=1